MSTIVSPVPTTTTGACDCATRATCARPPSLHGSSHSSAGSIAPAPTDSGAGGWLPSASASSLAASSRPSLNLTVQPPGVRCAATASPAITLTSPLRTASANISPRYSPNRSRWAYAPTGSPLALSHWSKCASSSAQALICPVGTLSRCAGSRVE